MEQIKILVASFVSFVVLDALWFSAFAARFAKSELGSLLKTNAQGGIELNLRVALGIYFLMALAVTFFVIPKTAGLPVFKSALWGAFLGLVVFGVYELTNYALIKGWTFNFVLVDMAWGAVAFFATTLAIKLIFKI